MRDVYLRISVKDELEEFNEGDFVVCLKEAMSLRGYTVVSAQAVDALHAVAETSPTDFIEADFKML